MARSLPPAGGSRPRSRSPIASRTPSQARTLRRPTPSPCPGVPSSSDDARPIRALAVPTSCAHYLTETILYPSLARTRRRWRCVPRRWARVRHPRRDAVTRPAGGGAPRARLPGEMPRGEGGPATGTARSQIPGLPSRFGSPCRSLVRIHHPFPSPSRVPCPSPGPYPSGSPSCCAASSSAGLRHPTLLRQIRRVVLLHVPTSSSKHLAD